MRLHKNLIQESKNRAQEWKNRAPVGITQVSDAPKNVLPISSIRPDPEQPRKRFNADEAKELEASIKTHGVIQPILVRINPENPKEYLIIAGERRWRAAKSLGLKEIPAVVRTESDEGIVQTLQLTENVIRDDLTPMEISALLNKMISNGQKKSEIANTLGKPASWITYHLGLLSLPDPLMQLYSSGELTDAARLYRLASHWDKFSSEIYQWIKSDDFQPSKILAFLENLKNPSRGQENKPNKSANVGSSDGETGVLAPTEQKTPKEAEKAVSEDSAVAPRRKSVPAKSFQTRPSIYVIYRKKNAELLYWFESGERNKGWIKIEDEEEPQEVSLADLKIEGIDNG